MIFSQAPILISRMENMCWAQAVWWIHIQAECQLSWQRRTEQFAAPVVSDKCYPPVIALVLTWPVPLVGSLADLCVTFHSPFQIENNCCQTGWLLTIPPYQASSSWITRMEAHREEFKGVLRRWGWYKHRAGHCSSSFESSGSSQERVWAAAVANADGEGIVRQFNPFPSTKASVCQDHDGCD